MKFFHIGILFTYLLILKHILFLVIIWQSKKISLLALILLGNLFYISFLCKLFVKGMSLVSASCTCYGLQHSSTSSKLHLLLFSFPSHKFWHCLCVKEVFLLLFYKITYVLFCIYLDKIFTLFQYRL